MWASEGRMYDERSLHAVLEDLGLVVTAAGGIISIVKSLSQLKKSSVKGFGDDRPVGPKHKINWPSLAAGLMFLVLFGIFLALNYFSERMPLVMVGSGNVQSYLTERVQNFNKLRPVMIDVGSGEGFNLVLQAAEFGGNARSTQARHGRALAEDRVQYCGL